MGHKYAVSYAEQKAAEAIESRKGIILKSPSHVGYAPIVHLKEAVEPDDYIYVIKRRDAIKRYNMRQRKKAQKADQSKGAQKADQRKSARVDNSAMKAVIVLSDEERRKNEIFSLTPNEIDLMNEWHIAYSNMNSLIIAMNNSRIRKGLSGDCDVAALKAKRARTQTRIRCRKYNEKNKQGSAQLPLTKDDGALADDGNSAYSKIGQIELEEGLMGIHDNSGPGLTLFGHAAAKTIDSEETCFADLGKRFPKG
ncbi:MAG: hypothetical protein COB66_06260 [Coxiella sp. (in: Bacteria)]|nr:MAG: hypothetical protein COB66_06260 [Coxiella sp. (in: g-proteobacteria)]